MGLLQSTQEEEKLVCLLDQGWGVEGPREVLRDVDTQELEAGDTLNLRSVDMDGGVCATCLPEVNNEIFGLLGVESQVVVGAPLRQVLDLFYVGRLIVVADEANHCYVVCKLDNGIRTINRCAVVAEEGVEERTQHTALWHAGVQDEGWGGVVLYPNRLGSVG